MNDRDLLLARGWRETPSGRWVDVGETRDLTHATYGAVRIQYQRDTANAGDHGSVTYRPTVEQAQVPLLAQCAAAGMHERDVIEHLFRAHEEQRRILLRRAELEVPRMVVTIAPGPLTEDEAQRWAGMAKGGFVMGAFALMGWIAEALRAASRCEYPEDVRPRKAGR